MCEKQGVAREFANAGRWGESLYHYADSLFPRYDSPGASKVTELWCGGRRDPVGSQEQKEPESLNPTSAGH